MHQYLQASISGIGGRTFLFSFKKCPIPLPLFFCQKAKFTHCLRGRGEQCKYWSKLVSLVLAAAAFSSYLNQALRSTPSSFSKKKIRRNFVWYLTATTTNFVWVRRRCQKIFIPPSIRLVIEADPSQWWAQPPTIKIILPLVSHENWPEKNV